jgi:ATP-dependent Clp protease ATP-binding subunit ClpC
MRASRVEQEGAGEVSSEARGQAQDREVTASARAILILAQEEATRLQDDEVHTAHYLLALARAEHGRGAQLLRERGFSHGYVRIAVENRGFPAVLQPRSGARIAPAALLQQAAAEAATLGSERIEGEHLLLALLHLDGDEVGEILGGRRLDRSSMLAHLFGEEVIAE